MTALGRYGPWALIVGAGAGIGEAYARQIAAAGLAVVLVDRDADGIERLATDLGPDRCRTLTVDLAEPDGPSAIVDAMADLDIGLLVANAALSHVGPFSDQPASTFREQVRVNVLAPTELVHRLLPRLRARDRSGVILMSSLSSRRGAPLVATYAATKAYLAILAESLWAELRGDGIDVLGVLPGSTRTPGWLASAPQASAGTDGVMDPADVAAEALAALGAGVPSIVTGAANRESEDFLNTLDRTAAVELLAEVMGQTYPPGRSVDPSV